MIIYLICFLVSTILIKASDSIKNKIFKSVLILCGLLLPCILAGLRAENIGKDISVYLKPIYECAKISSSFQDFLNMKFFQTWSYAYISISFERGFVILVYLLTKLFNNIQVIYFFIECLIVFPIYIGIKKYPELKDKTSLSMLIFYFLIYNQTLNLMRQSIAVAFAFLAMSFVINNEKNRNIKFIIHMVIAFFFHKSAVIMLAPYLLFHILNTNFKKERYLVYKNTKYSINKIIYFIIIIVSMLLLFTNNKIASMLDIIGMSEYSHYIEGNIGLSIYKLIKSLPILLLFLLSLNKKENRNNMNLWFYFINFFLDAVIISQLSSVFLYSGRIGLYMQVFNIIGFSLLCKDFKTKVNYRIILIFVYLISFWYYTFVVSNVGETVPFLFYF